MVDSSSQLPEVAQLLQACCQAESGSRRALILQAARLLSAPADQEPTDEQQSEAAEDAPADTHAADIQPAVPPPPAHPKQLSIVNLYESVPGAEKPWLPYSNRSKLPHKMRQSALCRLTAQHLALGLHRRGVPSSEGPAEVARNPGLRKVAIEAAFAQEAGLYTQSTGQEVYMSLASKATADALLVSPSADAAAAATQPGSDGTPTSIEPPNETPQASAPAGTDSKAANSSPAEHASAPGTALASATDQPPAASDPATGSIGPGEPLLPADVEVFRDSKASAAEPTAKRPKLHHAAHGATVQDVQDSIQAAELGNGMPTASAGAGSSEEPVGDSQAQAGLTAPKAASPDRGPQTAIKRPLPPSLPPKPPDPDLTEGGGASDHDHVVKAVQRFVRGHLDPLFKAQLITKQEYKQAAQRTVDKVVKAHADATSAEFLIREGEKIRKLAQRYITASRAQTA